MRGIQCQNCCCTGGGGERYVGLLARTGIQDTGDISDWDDELELQTLGPHEMSDLLHLGEWRGVSLAGRGGGGGVECNTEGEEAGRTGFSAVHLDFFPLAVGVLIYQFHSKYAQNRPICQN